MSRGDDRLGHSGIRCRWWHLLIGGMQILWTVPFWIALDETFWALAWLPIWVCGFWALNVLRHQCP